MTKTSKYKELGIDPGKSEVRSTFGNYIDNDYPNAFVNIVVDPKNPEKVFTMHMDGDGSKIVQRALHYLETKDQSVFKGAVDDAVSMNTGDVAASGFVDGKWIITDVININAFNLPKNIIMKEIAERFGELIDIYKENGLRDIYFLGGETADLPTQISSMVFDVGIQAETKKENIISGNVRAGDKIYGFASDGRASWEEEENSGIMSNGITLARIELMDKSYSQKYPFLSSKTSAYRGKYKIDDQPKILKGMTVGEALLSPTRQWALVIKKIIEKLKEKNSLDLLHGISMNTGGGATKIGHIGKGILYKKVMPEASPIFQLIQRESGESWENMFETFNCGVGIDVVGADENVFAEVMKAVAKETQIALYDLGACEEMDTENNKVVLQTPYGNFDNY